ncbi:MAG: hypothetical protein M3066_00465, partial [Actinomycetota bacterium]|nr:hypothetical protein [Actinomycetota bacterium]
MAVTVSVAADGDGVVDALLDVSELLLLPQAAPARASTPTSAVREALFFMFIGLSLFFACPDERGSPGL